MYNILSGLRVIEGASFVAGPICGEHLRELGAEVIRFDDLRGGLDAKRWPVDAQGTSLFWEGQNKGKKSIAVDLSKPEGRDLVSKLIAVTGIFVTNFPAEGFLAHERLAALRPDLITLRVMGWPDGRTAVDYTVNAATGLPLMTGSQNLQPDQPVNHVLPAWDLITGAYAAFTLLAAERHRCATQQGGEIRLALSDIAATTLAHLGKVAEISGGAPSRPRIGNDLFGALGRDFHTACGRQIILVAITKRQWEGLMEVFDLHQDVAALERLLHTSFADEGARFRHREALFALLEPRIMDLPLAALAPCLNAKGVCWQTYHTLHEAITEVPGFVTENTIFAPVTHPSGATYPTAGAPARMMGKERTEPPPAPRLGEHTEEILSDVLQLSALEIADLHDRHIVASA